MEDFLYSLTSGEWAGQLNAKSVLEARCLPLRQSA